MPPRSAALVAAAAPVPSDSFFSSGGEQAVIAVIVVAASRTAAVRAGIRTVPPSRAARGCPAAWVDLRCIGWRVSDDQASIRQRTGADRRVTVRPALSRGGRRSAQRGQQPVDVPGRVVVVDAGPDRAAGVAQARGGEVLVGVVVPGVHADALVAEESGGVG